MSNTWINIRFGTRHFKLGKGFSFIEFQVNPYHVKNKPEKFFACYEFFWYS